MNFAIQLSIFSIGLLICSIAYAGASAPDESVMQIGAGARATGLGGAFVAVADDATAAYWNPAGLSLTELYSYEAAMQYAFFPDELRGGYLSYVFQVPKAGAVSLAWINLTLSGITKRDEQGLAQGDFSLGENVFYLSYGQRVWEWVKGLSAGVNIKLLEQSLPASDSWGHGMDAGLLWQPVADWDHTLGLMVEHIQEKLYSRAGAWSVDMAPVNVKLGAALKFLRMPNALDINQLVLSGDLDWIGVGGNQYHAGLEYWFTEQFALRVGTNNQETTFGFSYRPFFYEVDYAFHYDRTELANHQHRLSLLLRYGGTSPTEKQQTLEESIVGTMNNEPGNGK